MEISDFTVHGIVDFSPSEIEATGAKLTDIKLPLMVAFQRFRSLMGRRVKLIFNGLTTGHHKSPLHPGGLAGDFYFDPREGPVKILLVFKAALEAGFKGIGVYWNGKSYSFHFDLRPKYAFWCGTKKPGQEWDYDKLIVDPKDL